MDTRGIRDFWLLTLESEGKANATRVTYRGHTEVFLKRLEGQELTPFAIRGFLADYRREHAPASLRSMLVTVRLFLRFAVREGLLPETLAAGLKLPKTPQAEKQVYSQGQLATILRVLEGNRSPLGLRDAALVALLIDTGARASEAVGLNVSDLQGDALVLQRTKSGRPRTLFLGKRSSQAIYRYLTLGRPKLKAVL